MKFPEAKNGNREYLVAAYICAVPELFERTSISEMEFGPMQWLINDFQEDEEGDQPERLMWLRDWRGEYLMSVLAINLWNGSHQDKFDLNEAITTWTPEYFKVFNQAVAIYRGRE